MEKLVYLKRAAPFIHEHIKTEAMQNDLAQSHRSIGSYFASKDSKRLGTGLTVEEERLLMPLLLKVDPANYVEFSKAKEDHYTNIVTKIPGGSKGRELNIGLEDNSKPLGYKFKEEDGKVGINLPDNIEDFCRWRHAIGFYHTAPSVEAAKGNQLAWYYIEDPTKVLLAEFADVEMKDNALLEYAKIKDNIDSVTMLLTVLKTFARKQNGKPPLNPANLGEKEKIIALRDIAVTRPEKFFEFATDKNLKKRYLVEEALSTGVIGRIGNMFVDKDDNNHPLGETVKEVIAFLDSPKETARIQRIKAAYNERKESKKILA